MQQDEERRKLMACLINAAIVLALGGVFCLLLAWWASLPPSSEGAREIAGMYEYKKMELREEQQSLIFWTRAFGALLLFCSLLLGIVYFIAR